MRAERTECRIQFPYSGDGVDIYKGYLPRNITSLSNYLSIRIMAPSTAKVARGEIWRLKVELLHFAEKGPGFTT